MNRCLSSSDLMDIPYFHPYITTPEQVVKVMGEAGRESGVFLIRRSFSQPTGHTISVRHEKGLFHMKIERTSEGRYQLNRGLSFPSIHHLLTHFSIHPITNVEKLEGVYLLRGIVYTQGMKLQQVHKSKSLGNEMGSVVGGGSNGGGNCSNGDGDRGNNGGGDSSNSGDRPMERRGRTRNSDGRNNPYIHPSNSSRSLDADDGFEEDDYMSNREVYAVPEEEEVMGLPESWQAVMKADGVVYKDASGGSVKELPYEIFTKLSSVQFERLKMYFEPLNSPYIISPSQPLTKPRNVPINNNNSSNNSSNNRNSSNSNNSSNSSNRNSNSNNTNNASNRNSSNNGNNNSNSNTPTSADDSKFILKGNSLYARMDGSGASS